MHAESPENIRFCAKYVCLNRKVCINGTKIAVFEVLFYENTKYKYFVMYCNSGTDHVYESGTKKSQEQLEKNIQTLTQYLSDINAFLVNGYTS